MKGNRRVAPLVLAASVAAAALSGVAVAALATAAPEGVGGALAWGFALAPVAAAAVLAGALARTPAAVALNSLMFFLPLAGLVVGGFLVLLHPGGPGGVGLLVGTREFWVKLLAGYVVSAVIVGGAALAFGALRRPPRGG